MLSKDLEQTLSQAFKGARSKRHEFMTVEHLLLALVDNDVAANVLIACGADLKQLRLELVDFVDSTTPLIPEREIERETQPTNFRLSTGTSASRFSCTIFRKKRSDGCQRIGSYF